MQNIRFDEPKSMAPNPAFAKETCPINIVGKVDRTAELVEKYRHHSVFQRIDHALHDGRKEVDIYRPAMSAQARVVTDEIIDLLRQMGMTVSHRANPNPSLALYVVSDLKAW